MKKINKTISIILAALMLLSLSLVQCFAEDRYAAFSEGTGYVALGDSFTRGYGAGENWQNEIYLNDTYGNFNCRNVACSYPNLIAEKYGLYAPDDIRDTDAKLWNISHDAVSIAYILDLLGIEDGYRDEEFLYDRSYMMERYETDLRYFGDPASFALDGSLYGQTGEVMSIREIINNAKLITVPSGQSDVVYKAQIFGLNEIDFGDTASIPAGVAHIIELLYEYFDYWKGAYPLLLDYIKENNPDATVVLIGTMNPIKNAKLTDDVAIKIGSVINVIFDSMNAYEKLMAAKYGYQFVDISDVETPSVAKEMSIGYILGISDATEFALQAHPTTKGYEQIAELITAAVDNDLEHKSLKSGFSFNALINIIRYFFKTLFSRLFHIAR